MKKFHWLHNLLLLAASVLVAFLVLEGLTRLLFPEWAPRAARLSQFWQYDARYGWSNIPNATGWFESFGFRSWVVHNTRGLRGPLVPYERVPGKRRLLVLGDSHCWGYGVNYHDAFPALLTKLIPDLEVINMSVSGYSTDQELLCYQDEGHKYGADVVLLLVSANDFLGNMMRTVYLVYGKPVFRLQDGALQLVNQPVPETAWIKRAAVGFASRLYLFSAVGRVLETLRTGGARAAHATDPADPFPRDDSEKITIRLGTELGRLVAQKQPNAKYLIVLVNDMGRNWAAETAACLRQFGIHSIWLGDYLDPRDPSLHLPDGIHWTPTGHRVIAQALAAHLRKKYLP
jgi:lysophospholipase L1-like esterase